MSVVPNEQPLQIYGVTHLGDGHRNGDGRGFSRTVRPVAIPPIFRHDDELPYYYYTDRSGRTRESREWELLDRSTTPDQLSEELRDVAEIFELEATYGWDNITRDIVFRSIIDRSLLSGGYPKRMIRWGMLNHLHHRGINGTTAEQVAATVLNQSEQLEVFATPWRYDLYRPGADLIVLLPEAALFMDVVITNHVNFEMLKTVEDLHDNPFTRKITKLSQNFEATLKRTGRRQITTQGSIYPLFFPNNIRRAHKGPLTAEETVTLLTPQALLEHCLDTVGKLSRAPFAQDDGRILAQLNELEQHYQMIAALLPSLEPLAAAEVVDEEERHPDLMPADVVSSVSLEPELERPGGYVTIDVDVNQLIQNLFDIRDGKVQNPKDPGLSVHRHNRKKQKDKKKVFIKVKKEDNGVDIKFEQGAYLEDDDQETLAYAEMRKLISCIEEGLLYKEKHPGAKNAFAMLTALILEEFPVVTPGEPLKGFERDEDTLIDTVIMKMEAVVSPYHRGSYNMAAVRMALVDLIQNRQLIETINMRLKSGFFDDEELPERSVDIIRKYIESNNLISSYDAINAKRSLFRDYGNELVTRFYWTEVIKLEEEVVDLAQKVAFAEPLKSLEKANEVTLGAECMRIDLLIQMMAGDMVGMPSTPEKHRIITQTVKNSFIAFKRLTKYKITDNSPETRARIRQEFNLTGTSIDDEYAERILNLYVLANQYGIVNANAFIQRYLMKIH